MAEISCVGERLAWFESSNSPPLNNNPITLPIPDARAGRTLLALDYSRGNTQYLTRPWPDYGIAFNEVIPAADTSDIIGISQVGFRLSERLCDGTEPPALTFEPPEQMTTMFYVVNSPRDGSAGNGLLDGATIRFDAQYPELGTTPIDELVPTRPDSFNMLALASIGVVNGPVDPPEVDWCSFGYQNPGAAGTSSVGLWGLTTGGLTIGDVEAPASQITPSFLMFLLVLGFPAGGWHVGSVAIG